MFQLKGEPHLISLNSKLCQPAPNNFSFLVYSSFMSRISISNSYNMLVKKVDLKHHAIQNIFFFLHTSEGGEIYKTKKISQTQKSFSQLRFDAGCRHKARWEIVLAFREIKTNFYFLLHVTDYIFVRYINGLMFSGHINAFIEEWRNWEKTSLIRQSFYKFS